MENIKTVENFKKLCITIGNLPSSFMESMSYYECLVWLVNYIDKNINPAINETINLINELNESFTILKDYVDNYFNNLDVQKEINNKLDDLISKGLIRLALKETYNSQEESLLLEGIVEEVI